MATVAESLFGVTPESLMADREQRLQQQALQFAQLNPMQAAQAGFYTAGSRLGGAIGGLLGAEDPELMRVRQRQELLQGLDPNDSKALRAKATELLNAGDYPAAAQLSQRALDIETKQAGIAKDVAAAQASMAGRTPADIQKAQRIAALNMAIPAYEAAGDTATAKLLKDERDALLPADKTVSYGAEAERVSQELYKKPFSQLTQPEMAAVNKRVEESSRKGTTVNVSVAGQKAFAEKLGELDAKKVSDAMAARDNAFTTIRSLDQLASLDDQGLISGSFATGRVGVTNLLNTLGLASPADQQRLASSQNYQKVAGDVILGVLGGKLGAGFSNEDRKFIEGLVPQLETSPAARRQLINFMRRKNMEIAEEASRLETYARENDGLKGFKPKIPLAGNVPVSGMSPEELARAAGGKIVNGKFVKNQ